MGWKVIVVFAAIPFIAACGMSQQMQINDAHQAAGAEQDRAVADCKAKYPDPHKKPVTPRAKCLADAFETRTAKLATTVGNPVADIERAYVTQTVALAERYDRGGMTESQYDAELAQLSVNSQTLAETRHNSAVAANAAQQQAAAARQSAAMQSMAAGQALMTPPQTNTRCTSFGNTLNCQNW